MTTAMRGNHQGIEFIIPANDDGCWRFLIPKDRRLHKLPSASAPSAGFATAALAVSAPRAAIDARLASPASPLRNASTQET
jgi:hypothetical protein